MQALIKTGRKPRWPREVHAVLRAARVRQVAVVPDAGHAQLIELCEKNKRMRVVRLTTEEEGVALLAGAWLGHEKGVLLLQSSGVGNCINMLTMPAACRFPLCMIVTMRGEPGEFNPAQVPMGQATQRVLEAMDVVVTRADAADDVAARVADAMNLAYHDERTTAVLIGQRVIGIKEFK
jgi:sulfopyruvate decarboxylase alpha subunit